MTYNVEAVRAERLAQRSTEPFTFEAGEQTWTMKHPDDLPATWFAWSTADYSRHFADLVVEPDFPIALLTIGDMDALVAAWLGATPGE